ncbi:MAG TPA: hypothetical protein VK003_10800 [Oceanobacillus sp.]|nr:hypothetical protein [Oceanobacillus sp.]
MNPTQKSRRLLVIGFLFAAFLWYLHWYHDGGILTGDTLRGFALIAYLISLLALIRYLTTSTSKRLLITGVVLLATGLLMPLLDSLLEPYYYQIFAATRSTPLETYDSRYLTNYRLFFVEPFILMLEVALFALGLTAFITLAFRKLRLSPQAEIAGA